MRSKVWDWCLGSIAAFGLLAFTGSIGFAQVKPRDFISADSAGKIKDLVSPGVFYKVQHGMSMRIIPTQHVDWPPPYKQATEKYSAQVRLTDDKRSLLGYVAGQPFPVLDVNDPHVAVKIMWNTVFKPMWTDDYDLRFYDCDSVYNQKDRPRLGQIDYFQIGHYAGYQLTGRTEVDPLPVDPDFKASGRYWLFGLYPVLAPAEIRGTGFLRFRYADAGKPDGIWAWLPGPRRIRRLNEDMVSSATALATSARSWDPDHYAGFDAKIEAFDYRLVGEKNLLGPIHSVHSPEIRCPTDNGTSSCPEAWEMRHMYVMSAKPRRGFGGQANREAMQSDTLIYVDGEVWFTPYIDTFDQKGQLYQNHIYWMAVRDRPVPDAKVAIYPFKRCFVVGAAATDVQSGLATMCYMPGIETPERECWYINMGAVDKEFFTTQAMTKAAP